MRMTAFDKFNPSLYYSESFFSKDSLFHPEMSGVQLGEAGIPIPYTPANDDAIIGMLCASFMLLLIVFACSRQIILYRLKRFFYVPHSDKLTTVEKVSGFYLLPLLDLVTCLLLSILFLFNINNVISEPMVVETSYGLVAIFFSVFTAYFMVKMIAYNLVNVAFFDGKKCQQWNGDFILITALEGAALFPMAVVQVYYEPSVQNTVYYLVFILILVKILTFYKCWILFFRQISVVLQIILYLCALEIIPLLALWGSLVLITNNLKVFF
jgi:hypothetical protein